jgi:amino acid adenylation domain-containing protein
MEPITQDVNVFTGKAYRDHFVFWQQTLGKVEEAFRFGRDVTAPQNPPAGGVNAAIVLDEAACKVIASIAGTNPVGVYVVMVAAIQVLLSRYAASAGTAGPVVLKSPLLKGEEPPQGYAGPVILAGTPSPEGTLRQVLTGVKLMIAQAYEYQDFPLHLVPGLVAPPDELSNVRVYDAAIHEGFAEPVTDDLTISIRPAGRQWVVGIRSRRPLMEPWLEKRFLPQLEWVVKSFATLETRLADVDVVPGAEKAQLLANAAGPVCHYGAETTLLKEFEYWAQTTPHAVAVQYKDTQLTYGALDKKADQLACYLREEAGIGTGDRVGLLVERSERLIIAMLGAMKAGAAYVPLNPAYPAARIDYMVRDTQMKALLIDSFQMNDLPAFDGPVFVLDFQLDMLEEPARRVSPAAGPADLAYVIYTSGTTGTPKGVLIEHRQMINTLLWRRNHYRVQPQDVALQIFPASFDGSVTDIFTSLVAGGKLVIPEEKHYRDTGRLAGLIERHQVSHYIAIPSFHELLLDQLEGTAGASLRFVTVAGERLTGRVADKHFGHLPGVALHNEYGPTENAVCTTAAELTPGTGCITVGRPIANVHCYILDEHFKPVPPGMAGQLCVGGRGVARGYLNQEALTQDKFRPDPFRPGERMYLTGDRGRWLEDGSIELTGRLDQQVKIRGYRVELAEIERAALQHAEVEDIAVRLTQTAAGGQSVIAYLVSRSGSPEGVKQLLAQTLPEYMVPDQWVLLTHMPLTPSGKKDLEALAAQATVPAPEAADYVAPAGPVETKLAAIWGAVLGRTDVSAEANLFAIGGNSLNALQIVSLIYKDLHVKLDLGSIFESRTIRALAKLIAASEKVAYARITPKGEHPDYELSHNQKRLWFLNQSDPEGAAYNISRAFELRGPLDLGALEAAFGALIARHEMLRTTFVTRQGQPRQCIHAPNDSRFRLAYVHLAGAGEALPALMAAEKNAPFDLETGPLLRAKLIETAPGAYTFVLTLHHIACDGWSLIILFNEVIDFYNGFVTGQAPAPKPLEIQYKDFAAWQQDQLAGEKLQRLEAFWLERFAGPLPTLQLATDFSRPPRKAYGGSSLSFCLPATDAAKVKLFAEQLGVGAFVPLLASVVALLYHYSGQTQLVVGLPTAGRTHTDLDDQIGFYINTLALRCDFSGQDTFYDLLQRLKTDTQEAYAHQEYPFDLLVERLNLRRDPSREPLFDVMVQMLNIKLAGGHSASMREVAVTPCETGSVSSQFDLSFDFYEDASGFGCNLNYDTALFRDESIVIMKEKLLICLAEALENPHLPLSSLDFTIMAEEKTGLDLSDDFAH